MNKSRKQWSDSNLIRFKTKVIRFKLDPVQNWFDSKKVILIRFKTWSGSKKISDPIQIKSHPIQTEPIQNRSDPIQIDPIRKKGHPIRSDPIQIWIGSKKVIRFKIDSGSNLIRFKTKVIRFKLIRFKKKLSSDSKWSGSNLIASKKSDPFQTWSGSNLIRFKTWSDSGTNYVRCLPLPGTGISIGRSQKVKEAYTGTLIQKALQVLWQYLCFIP